MYNCIDYILTCIKSLSLFFDKQPDTKTETKIETEPDLIQVQHYYDYNIPTDKLIIRSDSGFESRYIL